MLMEIRKDMTSEMGEIEVREKEIVAERIRVGKK